MKCPVCGAKMVDGVICKYCNVTSEQVTNASNKEAKRAFKENRKQDVCYTTEMPSDVNKKKLTLFTIFLGWYGVGNFYVGKTLKGIYCAISFGLAILFSALRAFISNSWGTAMIYIVGYGWQISGYLFMVNLLMWFADIMGLIFKTYKVPVVLAEDEIKMRHHSIKRKVK